MPGSSATDTGAIPASDSVPAHQLWTFCSAPLQHSQMQKVQPIILGTLAQKSTGHKFQMCQQGSGLSGGIRTSLTLFCHQSFTKHNHVFFSKQIVTADFFFEAELNELGCRVFTLGRWITKDFFYRAYLPAVVKTAQ